jgi:hypothetical protein
MKAGKAEYPNSCQWRGETPARRTAWYSSLGFWRAVAGMALALVLACVVITFEFASEMSHRSSHYRLRVAQLYNQINHMHGQIVMAERRLAGLHSEVTARDDMNRILASSDAQLIKLASPEHGGGSSGLIVVSKRLGSAVLEVAGLPVLPPGQSYALWWVLEPGVTVRAAQFQTEAEGRASVIAKLPPRESPITSTIITVESENSADRPTASVKLKSAALKAEATR